MENGKSTSIFGAYLAHVFGVFLSRGYGSTQTFPRKRTTMQPKRSAGSIQEPAGKRRASGSNAAVNGPAGYQFEFKMKKDS